MWERSCGAGFLRIVCPFVLSLGVLYGQGTGTIGGTVSDPANAPVPGAAVIITNAGTGFARMITTNSAGSYSAPELPVGQYVVRVETAGFKAYERKSVVLNVNDTIRVDAVLEVGEVRESITVEANPVQVQADTNEVSQTITDTQVSELATNGRNVIQLTTLVPGAAATLPDFDSPVAQFQNRSVNFNGQRSDHNDWIIDGGEAYDRGGGGILIVSPSQDALQEFKVITSNYAADLGLASGGMISMAIKSGTRQFHGGAWEYNRNDFFDASNYFSNLSGQAKPELRYNTFGFNLGGPLTIPHVYNRKREKTFFFYNMEWRRLVQGGEIFANAVPAALQTGNFAGFPQIHVPQTSDPAALAKFAQYGLNPGQPFPNNQIPAGLIDPNVSLLLKTGIFPAANAPGNHYSAAVPTRTNYREETVRIDHQFTDKLTLLGDLIYDSGVQNQPTPLWSGDTYPTVGSALTVPSWAGVVHLTATISPSLLNEAAFNFNGNNINIGLNGTYQKPAGYDVAPFFQGNTANRIPVIQLGQPFFANYDTGSWPWSNTYRSYQAKDDVSFTHGNHNFKFGASWLHTRKNQEIFGNTNGVYNFSGTFTGNAFADFLLGFANSYNELQLQDFVHVDNNTFSIYGLDNWRVNRRLTLNLGLRWEGIPHAYDVNNRLSNFYQNLYNPAQAPQFLPGGSLNPSGPGFGTVSGIALSNVPFYLNGLGLAGRNGIPSGLVQNYWDTFAPRVGFAYDATGDQKTIVRGGFGMFYERIGGNDVYNMGGDPPFSFDPSPSNIYFSNPSVSATTGQTASSPVFPSTFTGLSGSNYKLPTSVQYSFGIQRQLQQNAVLTVTYVGNVAYHQTENIHVNTVPWTDPNRLAICGGNCGYTGTAYNPNLDRIYPGFADISLIEAAGNSNYNSLQVSLRATAWKNLTFSGSYTYSHAFDILDGDLNNSLSNPFNRLYDYGSAGYDRRHIAIFSYVYSFPFFRNANSHVTKALLGGWELSGVTTFETGNPLSVSLGYDNLGLGGGTANRADAIGAVSYPQSRLQWFSTSSFAAPAPLAFGNSGKGVIVGPGRDNWNIALFKSFAIKESTRFEFRAETFNTFNHTQFNAVSTTLTSGSFGQVTSVFDPRVFQLGAKFLF